MPKLTAEEQEALKIISAPAVVDDPGTVPLNGYGQLTPEDISTIQQEQALAEQFDKPGTAAALAAARGLTLGLSDAALTSFGVDANTLKNIKEQSPNISTTAEIAGAVAPTLVSGGAAVPAGLASKAAQKLGAATAKNITSNLGRKATELAVAGAAEGAAFSLGTALSQAALNNERLSAETAISAIGTGAAMGGALGGVLGAGVATVPKVLKVAKPFTKRVGGIAENFTDPAKIAEDWSGLGTAKIAKRNSRTVSGTGFSDDLAEHFRTRLLVDAPVAPSTEELLKINLNVQNKAGKQLEQLTNTLSTVANADTQLLTKTNIGTRLASILDDAEKQLSSLPRQNRDLIRAVRSTRQDIAPYIQKVETNAAGAFSELDKLRKALASKAYNKATGDRAANFLAGLNDDLRHELRTITDEVADSVATKYGGDLVDVATQLKEANKAYSMASVVAPGLAKRSAKASTETLFEVVRGTIGDTAKSLAMQWNVGSKVNGVKLGVAESIKEFFKKTTRPTLTLANKGLANSGFAITENKKTVSDSRQAYQNIKNELHSLTADPEKLADRVAKASAPMFLVSPNMGLAAQEALVSGINFLHSKLPRAVDNSVSRMLFQKEYQPTSLELAKFERYVQIVEQPLTILEELQQGTITREHVEALKIVYPELYTLVQDQVMEQIAQEPNLSYQKKLQLGILLDIPADASLEPEHIMGLQASIGGQQSQPPQAGAPSNPNAQAAFAANMDNMNVAAREESGVQKLTNRRI